jgi:hemoglobin-like flavoprotein
MDTHTIRQVQESWASVKTAAPQAGTLFYATLFDADPALRPLFRGDMSQQATKLVQMIDAAVHGLDDLPSLLPVLEQLGRRHQGYGVQPAHYGTVGAALLSTLAQGLGSGFTPALRGAWTEVYGALASAMQAAAPPAHAQSGG